MTAYVLLYLLIGAILFWPMLKLDKETRDYASVTKLRMFAAFVAWCVVWFPSMVLDFLFWVLRGRDDD